MSRLLLRAAVLAAAFLPALAAPAALTLEAALDLAVERSAAARAARAASTGAAEAAQAAGQLPDPMLRVGIENLPVTGADRFSTTSDSQTMKRLGISQEWLSSDKRAARRAAADSAQRKESIQAAVAAADARLQTAWAYLDAWYAGEALALTTLSEHHLHEEIEAARARLASAGAAGADVLALTGSLGVAEDDSAEVRQQQASAMLALARWTGVAAAELAAVAPWTPPSESDFVARHPAVAALQREADVARSTAAVAAGDRSPNWTWEVSYGQRTGYPDMVSVGVSIPLAVAPSQRQDRETAARRAFAEKAEADLAEATRAAGAEFLALANDAGRLQQRIERYRAGVLAPARQRTAALLAAYRSNQAPLTALFEARHAEVELQRKLLALERDLARTRAQLALKPVTAGATP